MSLKFEWDDTKAEDNLRKHGVSFSEATTIFGDPLARSVADPLHSDEEGRFITMGQSRLRKTLVVVHTYRGEVI